MATKRNWRDVKREIGPRKKPCRKCGCMVNNNQGGCQDCGRLRARAQVARWRKANPEKMAAVLEARKNRRKADVRYKNAENAKTREWFRLHPGYKKQYNQENKESLSAYNAAWVKANHDKVMAKKYRRRGREKGVLGAHTSLEWETIKKKFKHKCASCGERKKLTRDHIVPLCLGGSNYAMNIQPLCLSCNCSKHARLAPDVQFSLFDRVAS